MEKKIIVERREMAHSIRLESSIILLTTLKCWLTDFEKFLKAR